MKVGVLIGRFQVPEPHEGHKFLINRILERVDRLIILVGSANRARSVRNPFTYKERQKAIYSTFDYKHNLMTVPINDYMYNDNQWMADVASTIRAHTDENDEITLFGHFKPGNDYLKWFPQMRYENIDTEVEISGTEMRNANRHLLPQVVQDEMAAIDKENLKFRDYPYAGHLNIACGDAVVTCLGHVLLIKRPNGNWALPGGHKLSNETYQQCALRELYEETNLRVPTKVVHGSIRATRLFDHPLRSGGLPRHTVAVYCDIQPNPDGTLPRANGSDDAVDAAWFPIQVALNDMRLHDDHSDILSEMTGVKPLIAYENRSIYDN